MASETKHVEMSEKKQKEVMDLLVGGRSKVKTKSAALGDTRAVYFKGKHAVNALLRNHRDEKETVGKEGKKKKIETREEAVQVLDECLKSGKYFSLAEKVGKGKLVKVIVGDKNKDKFSEEKFYILEYEGSKLKGYIQGAIIIIAVFSLAVFQIWPERPRRIVYNIAIYAITIPLALLIISVIRLLVNFISFSLFGVDLWILPNLFEDVSIKENFIPFYKIF